MTKSADVAPEAGTGAKNAETKNGFLKDWVLPIVLGLVIGGAAVGAWRAGRGLLHSKAWNVVEKWQYDESDANDALTKDLRALGPQARADIVQALRDLPAEQIEIKIWLARQLAGEPWFDTTSLKEIVRDPKAAKEDQRAAACALVDTQSKEVDSELVLPVFEAWLQDASAPDHGYAITRIDRMWRAGMLNSQWEARIKRVLMAEAVKRPAAAKPEDEERITEDRAFAILTLETGLPDEEIKTLFWTVAKDETDGDLPRINAVRALSEGQVTDEKDVDSWAIVAQAKNDVVRQTVAENLFRAQAPVYDKVIEPLQFDANYLARTGALDTQIKRRRPTMLKRFDELLEDSYDWARYNAMFAAGVFKSETEGQPQRAAMMLRLIESSDDKVDVMGAVLCMKMLTDQVYGFKPDEVHVHEQNVEETALEAFMADKNGRKQAADKWRGHFGAAAVWLDSDRVKTLEKLLKHADPKNVERAQQELEALRKNKP